MFLGDKGKLLTGRTWAQTGFQSYFKQKTWRRFYTTMDEYFLEGYIFPINLVNLISKIASHNAPHNRGAQGLSITLRTITDNANTKFTGFIGFRWSTMNRDMMKNAQNCKGYAVAEREKIRSQNLLSAIFTVLDTAWTKHVFSSKKKVPWPCTHLQSWKGRQCSLCSPWSHCTKPPLPCAQTRRRNSRRCSLRTGYSVTCAQTLLLMPSDWPTPGRTWPAKHRW